MDNTPILRNGGALPTLPALIIVFLKVMGKVSTTGSYTESALTLHWTPFPQQNQPPPTLSYKGGGFEPSLLWHARWLNANEGMVLLLLQSLPAVQFSRELEAKVPVIGSQEPSPVSILSRI